MLWEGPQRGLGVPEASGPGSKHKVTWWLRGRRRHWAVSWADGEWQRPVCRGLLPTSRVGTHHGDVQLAEWLAV